MSERMKVQLLYSQYVNTHASKGHSIPCDLHMKHLTGKSCKSVTNVTQPILYNKAHLLPLACRNLKVLIGGEWCKHLIREYSRVQQPLHHLRVQFDSSLSIFTVSILQQRHFSLKLFKDILLGAESLNRGAVFEDRGRRSQQKIAAEDSGRRSQLKIAAEDRS